MRGCSQQLWVALGKAAVTRGDCVVSLFQPWMSLGPNGKGLGNVRISSYHPSLGQDMCAGVQRAVKKQGRIPMSTTNLCGLAWPAAHTWGRGKVFPSATPVPQQQHLSASISHRPAKCIHAQITLSLRRQGCTQPLSKTSRLVLQQKSYGV